MANLANVHNSYICSFDEETKKKARDELGEENPAECVDIIRTWLLEQSSFLRSPSDAVFLLAFLRNRKYDLTETKERLKTYWKKRTENPRWFLDIDVHKEIIKLHLLKGIFQPLPLRDSEGSVFILARFGLVDDTTVEEFDEQIKTAVACMDHLLKSEQTQVAGIKFIYDLENLSFRQVFTFGEENIRKLTSVWLRTYPVRFRAIHYINTGPVFDFIIKIIKQIVPKKIKDRIHTHKYLASLYKKIDMHVLPLEYLPDDYTGRNAGSLSTIISNFCDEISKHENREYLVDLSSAKYTSILHGNSL